MKGAYLRCVSISLKPGFSTAGLSTTIYAAQMSVIQSSFCQKHIFFHVIQKENNRKLQKHIIKIIKCGKYDKKKKKKKKKNQGDQ